MAGPGTQQTGGLTQSQVNKFYQGGGIQGSLGTPVIGADGFVTMGDAFSTYTGYSGGQATSSRTPYNIDTAQNFYYSMSDTFKSEWLTELERQLGWDVAKRPQTGQEYWSSYVTRTAAYNKATNSAISPMELIRMENDQLARLGKLPSGKGGGSGSSTVVNLTNPSDARLVVNNALQQYLGRDATEEESEAFLNTLNQVERKNPIRTTKSSRSGGVNPNEVAKEVAMADKNYAETAVNSTYMGWLLDAVQQDPTEGVVSGL
jgi:hypothetical protein